MKAAFWSLPISNQPAISLRLVPMLLSCFTCCLNCGAQVSDHGIPLRSGKTDYLTVGADDRCGEKASLEDSLSAAIAQNPFNAVLVANPVHWSRPGTASVTSNVFSCG